MAQLKYFNKRKYYDISQAFKEIRQELEELWDAPKESVTEETYGTSTTSYVPNVAADSATSSGDWYNGPFKLVAEGDVLLNGITVYIVDGATHDAINHTSHDMLVKVNNRNMYIKSFKSAPKKVSATFAVRFTSLVDEHGNISGNKAAIEIVDLSIDHNNVLPQDSLQYVWKRVGRLILKPDGNYVLSQDHIGDMTLEWYAPCTGL